MKERKIKMNLLVTKYLKYTQVDIIMYTYAILIYQLLLSKIIITSVYYTIIEKKTE